MRQLANIRCTCNISDDRTDDHHYNKNSAEYIS